MARILKFFRVLRRNPKKSILFSALLAGGVNFAKDKYEEKQIMRAFCEKAMEYGECPKPLGEPERHITVLLNPAAKGGKGKLFFDRYCAPLLYLAGIKVAVVKTEHEGQARDLMEIIDNTSAVVVAGGDGTLGEVLTGLLRRVDHSDAVQRFPLGILPLGNTNTATSALWGFRGNPKPQHLAEATMAIVHDIKRPFDVMEITQLQDPEKETIPKPVYAASSVEWGAYRDAYERKDTYWYWSVLKKYMTYVFSSYKDITWDCPAEVEVSAPCSGCSRCRADADHKSIEKDDTPEPLKRWWMAYLPKQQPVPGSKPDEEEKIDYNSITNDDCGVLRKSTITSICDVVVCTRNTPQSLEVPNYALLLKTGLPNTGTLDFIKEGWSREWNKFRNYAAETTVGEITLRPTGNTKTEKGIDRELNIDSEAFEVRPMKIKMKPSAVTVFAPLSPPTADYMG